MGIRPNKTFHSWKDLEQYGIALLTGERCAYIQRGLFDLNQEGMDTLCGYFGFRPGETAFDDPWNSRVNDKPSVCSIMLPWDMYSPLCKYLLMHIDRYKFVYINTERMVVTGSDENWRVDLATRQMKPLPVGWTMHLNHNVRTDAPKHDGFHTHLFTGR